MLTYSKDFYVKGRGYGLFFLSSSDAKNLKISQFARSSNFESFFSFCFPLACNKVCGISHAFFYSVHGE